MEVTYSFNDLVDLLQVATLVSFWVDMVNEGCEMEGLADVANVVDNEP